MIIELVYIGESFSIKSKGRMGMLYKLLGQGYEKYDWEFVQSALAKGTHFTIRPATKHEKKLFKEELKFVLANMTVLGLK